MDLNSVRQLADLMEQYGLASAEVQEGEHRIALAKPAAPAYAAAQAAPVPPPAGSSPAPAEEKAEEKRGEELTSPLVGVVYLAPSPDAEPFVRVGSRVKKGQPLCIVEAMKVMNEFCAPRDGEIAEVCVQNGELAECGRCLFRLL